MIRLKLQQCFCGSELKQKNEVERCLDKFRHYINIDLVSHVIIRQDQPLDIYDIPKIIMYRTETVIYKENKRLSYANCPMGLIQHHIRNLFNQERMSVQIYCKEIKEISGPFTSNRFRLEYIY